MNKIALILIIIIFALGKIKAEDNTFILSGNVNLSEETDHKVDIFASYYGKLTNDVETIAKIKVEPNTDFELELPKYVTNCKITFACPGFKTVELGYLRGDEEPEVNVTLTRNKISGGLDSAEIVVINGKLQKSFRIPVENSKYEGVFSLESDELSELGLSIGDSILYCYKLNNLDVTPLNGDEELEYSVEKIYFAKRGITDNAIKFKLNFADYMSDSETKGSRAEWIDSPTNKKFNEAIELLPYRDISSLNGNYSIFIRERLPELLVSFSDSSLKKMKQKVTNKFNRYINSVDSLLEITDEPYLSDYLRFMKLKILDGPDSLNTITDIERVMKNSKEVPFQFSGLFSNLSRSNTYQKRPDENIKFLEGIAAKSSDPIVRNHHIFNIYSGYFDTELSDSAKYSELIQKKYDQLQNSKHLLSWVSEVILKDLAKLKLKTMTYAPDFKFKTTNGKEKKLSDYKGKWVLLDFWGTWCGPCRAETPHLVKAYEKMKDKNFEIVSISSDRSVEVLKKYMVKNKMTWPNTIDLDGYAKGVLELYGVSSYPTLMLIDPEGKFTNVKSYMLRSEDLVPSLKEQMGR